MADKTKIEWTRGDDGSPGATWNPVTGCTKVSPGCDHCYAETFAERFRGTPGHHFENGFDVTLRPERLDQPLRWKKPRRIFVNSMSDLFHNDIADEFIAEVFAVMSLAPQHTFQVLTKRHARLSSLLNRTAFRTQVQRAALSRVGGKAPWLVEPWWPLRNVWVGVSVEDQKWADIRIPALLDTPATVRWISAEPLLGPLDITRYLWLSGASTAGPFRDHAGRRRGGGGAGGMAITHIPSGDLGWVVVGGESGPGSRPMHPQWARDLRDQCAEAGVAFLYKQSGQFAPVADQPRPGDLWQAIDGATAEWKHDDGHIREGGGDFRWPGSRTTLMRRARSKHDAGRTLDGATYDGYPSGRTAVTV